MQMEYSKDLKTEFAIFFVIDKTVFHSDMHLEEIFSYMPDSDFSKVFCSAACEKDF